MRQVTLFRKPDLFAGWPANYGAWAFGAEIVVVFAVGRIAVSDHLHARDMASPFRPVQMRSLDSGLTWSEEPFPGSLPGTDVLSTDEHMIEPLRAGPRLSEEDFTILADPIDFLDEETAILCARTGLRAGAVSWFYVSRDHCRSWTGPYLLPDLGEHGTAARTDIVPLSSREALWLLTVPSEEGEGGIICVKTSDGGLTFEPISTVSPEEAGYAIMPSTVRLADGTLVSIVRRPQHLEVAVSSDGGGRWTTVNRNLAQTGPFGNPGSLVRLDDERIAVIYGRRSKPYAICARTSSDGGVNWGDETVIREQRGSADFGYPRSTQVAPGRFLTIYYLNDEPEAERYIGGTLWDREDLHT